MLAENPPYYIFAWNFKLTSVIMRLMLLVLQIQGGVIVV